MLRVFPDISCDFTSNQLFFFFFAFFSHSSSKHIFGSTADVQMTVELQSIGHFFLNCFSVLSFILCFILKIFQILPLTSCIPHTPSSSSGISTTPTLPRMPFSSVTLQTHHHKVLNLYLYHNVPCRALQKVVKLQQRHNQRL